MTATVERRATPDRGEGIFALQPFKRGEILYAGVLDGAPVDNHSHASQISKTKFGFHTGLGSILNHSCNPNCGIIINESGAHDIVAMEGLAAGDEATYDYAMRNYRIDHFPSPCCCGNTNCRGTITGWINLPQQRKDAYAGFVAPYLLEIDLEQGVASRKGVVSNRVLAGFKTAIGQL